MLDHLALLVDVLTATYAESTCAYDPRQFSDDDGLGMFHCPRCGEMQIAGFEHSRPGFDDSGWPDAGPSGGFMDGAVSGSPAEWEG